MPRAFRGGTNSSSVWSPYAKQRDVRAFDIAKWLLDKGVHPPTMYFPLIVKEALMIEPTESECKQELEEALEEAWENPDIVKSAPTATSVARVDEVAASHPRSMAPSWRWWKRREEKRLTHNYLSALREQRFDV